jgi:tRNA-specific 2-thiouridylase
VLCNAEIKFKAFLDHAMKLGADLIATGHYARVRENAAGKFELLKAFDHTKDQSYFLHRLNQAQLSKSLFPLGEIPKTEVRKIAEKLKLPNAAKKDSTGICFIGERPFRDFLNRYLSHKPGPMKLDNGQTVGEHIGLSFYTLGQRKGIGIGGLKSHKNADGTSEPWFVARKDIANNTLYIVQGHDHPWLLSSRLEAGQASWVAGEAPAPGLLSAKTRYRQADVACEVAADGLERFALDFTEPQWAVTPGQSAVLYDGDICLGGGIIDGASAVNG